MNPFRWINGLVAILALSMIVTALNYNEDFSDLPPGPYCAFQGCCNGREDECSAPIIGTRCYCDDFCTKNRVDDCCPDYWSHCLNIPQPLLGCTFEGNTVYLGSIRKKNCNVCKCEKSTANHAEMFCEESECLIEPEIIESVNRFNMKYGWKATNYSKFWGRKLDEGISLRLGTLEPSYSVKNMSPKKSDKYVKSIPREFDFTIKWPNLTSPIEDQKWCGSSWAISTVAVASDRFSFESNITERVALSAQHLISCSKQGQRGCHGGHIDRAWLLARKYGLIYERCFTYTGTNERCKFDQYSIRKHSSLKKFGCKNVTRTSTFKVGPAYRLNNETDIMNEIIISGPVQATMRVYHDFFTYREGIYRHTELSRTQKSGYHSVRIVGWGEDYTYTGVQKYWKVANSWGPEWGENGYFRILRGVNECEIESFVLGVWPKLMKDEIKKRN